MHTQSLADSQIVNKRGVLLALLLHGGAGCVFLEGLRWYSGEIACIIGASEMVLPKKRMGQSRVEGHEMRRPFVLLIGVLVVSFGACSGGDTEGRPCESMEELGNPCSTGQGQCVQMGTLECTEDGGTLVCSAVSGPPLAETCDGKDNDCDGLTDEELDEEARAGLLGVCEELVRVCAGAEGWAAPDFSAVPEFETEEKSCDGLDNDCDGETDEEVVGNAPAGVCPGQGVCKGKGEISCLDGAWLCSLETIEAYEESESTCDGLDNDCDGEVDEDLVGGASAECSVEGVCAQGVKAACADGQWACGYDEVAEYESPEVSCDGKDNDCDGATDEELTPKEADGSCTALGVCASGVMMTCADGGWNCDYTGVVDWESVEVSCDNQDNDCDGETDEGWTCQGGGCDAAAAGSLKCSASIGGSGVPAIDASGTIYIAAGSPDYDVPYLAALSPVDCSVLWEFHPQKEAPLFCQPPIIRHDGKLLFSCNCTYSDVKNPIYVVTPEGQLESTIETPEGIAPPGIVVASDGTLYFGNRYCCGEFYAYKPDGSMKWFLDTGGSEFQADPAMGPDGLIYAGTWKFKGSPEEKFYAFSDSDGAGDIEWEFAPPENPGQYDTSGIMVNASPVLDGLGTVYVGILGQLGDDLGTTLYALDASTGAEKWHHTDPSSHASLNNSLVIGPSGTIYMVTGKFGEGLDDPTTMLLHAVTSAGAPLWAEPTPFAGFTWNVIPAVGKDGNLYVAAQDNAYGIDGETGATLWSYQFTGAPYGVALGYTGVMYFLTGDAFYAICTDSNGLADSAWPKAMHDARNTSDFSAVP